MSQENQLRLYKVKSPVGPLHRREFEVFFVLVHVPNIYSSGDPQEELVSDANLENVVLFAQRYMQSHYVGHGLLPMLEPIEPFNSDLFISQEVDKAFGYVRPNMTD